MNQVITCAKGPTVFRGSATSSAGPIDGSGYSAAVVECSGVRVPMITMHNSGDSSVPFSQGEAVRTFWAHSSRNACNLNDFTNGNPAPSCRIYNNCQGATQAWCQTSRNVHNPYSISSTDNAGIAAWNFFSSLISGDPN